ncbi:Prolyl 4-hydroxylase alpha subunit [Reticulomyxa filosa]|uniref:Prolyl 4-hydroxylase alpha subunit n=1 Tax=Reticulomyxa filosa TaxID=46433 RepID=X6MGG8_RETFI|nr:Prolyl 4-hydroxylase alpha subunit [Reticulomyxa filosa]|eukprot:ETO12974.1 Prolyl 4-hydroxylase alpha subunit [Reticulomyxa filosa]
MNVVAPFHKKKKKGIDPSLKIEYWVLAALVVPLIVGIIVHFARNAHKEAPQDEEKGIHSESTFWQLKSLPEDNVHIWNEFAGSEYELIGGNEKSGLNLWIVQNYLENSVARAIHDILTDDFLRIDSELEEVDTPWVFTYNEYNKKIRNNQADKNKIIQRQTNKLKNHEFAYIKYEYMRNSTLYKKLIHWLNSSTNMDSLSVLLKDKVTMLTDMFVTAYGHKHFLSWHNDYGLGKYAFVYMLSSDWNGEEYGGRLLFSCPKSSPVFQANTYSRSVCKTLNPAFNTLVLFTVFPNNVPHMVEQILVDAKPRLAITGWITNKKEEGFDRTSSYYEQLGNIV